MNIDFHYYITYLILTGIGVTPDDARTIANSAQYVDDNNMKLTIDEGRPTQFHTVPTFSMDLTEKPATRHLTYAFHFTPGDSWTGDQKENPLRRKDGKTQITATTPGNTFATEMVKEAFKSKSKYELGIALHMYEDTFAHQGFCGHESELNKVNIGGCCSLYSKLPPVGHSNAGHAPDLMVTWEDNRLVHEHVNNHKRHSEAVHATASLLYDLYQPYIAKEKNENSEKGDDEKELLTYTKKKAECIDSLVEKIGIAMMTPSKIEESEEKDLYKLQDQRVKNYVQLSLSKTFGEKEISLYDADKWFSNAVYTKKNGISDEVVSKISLGLVQKDLFPDEYTWKSTNKFEGSLNKIFKEKRQSKQTSSLENILSDIGSLFQTTSEKEEKQKHLSIKKEDNLISDKESKIILVSNNDKRKSLRLSGVQKRLSTKSSIILENLHPSKKIKNEEKNISFVKNKSNSKKIEIIEKRHSNAKLAEKCGETYPIEFKKTRFYKFQEGAKNMYRRVIGRLKDMEIYDLYDPKGEAFE